MIYTQVTKHSFIDAFKQSSRKDQFSYDALEAIYEYLEDYSQDSGENVELDIVAICCDWAEENYKDVFNTHPIDCDSENPTDDEIKEAVQDYLEYHTQCVLLPDGETFVYVQF
jgi:hypothetical protein